MSFSISFAPLVAFTQQGSADIGTGDFNPSPMEQILQYANGFAGTAHHLFKAMQNTSRQLTALRAQQAKDPGSESLARLIQDGERKLQKLEEIVNLTAENHYKKLATRLKIIGRWGDAQLDVGNV